MTSHTHCINYPKKMVQYENLEYKSIPTVSTLPEKLKLHIMRKPPRQDTSNVELGLYSRCP